MFTILPLQRPRGISQNVSGLYYVRRSASYKIHMCAKLFYIGRAKVFSSVATDFGPSTICLTLYFSSPPGPLGISVKLLTHSLKRNGNTKLNSLLFPNLAKDILPFINLNLHEMVRSVDQYGHRPKSLILFLFYCDYRFQK